MYPSLRANSSFSVSPAINLVSLSLLYLHQLSLFHQAPSPSTPHSFLASDQISHIRRRSFAIIPHNSSFSSSFPPNLCHIYTWYIPIGYALPIFRGIVGPNFTMRAIPSLQSPRPLTLLFIRWDKWRSLSYPSPFDSFTDSDNFSINSTQFISSSRSSPAKSFPPIYYFMIMYIIPALYVLITILDTELDVFWRSGLMIDAYNVKTFFFLCFLIIQNIYFTCFWISVLCTPASTGFRYAWARGIHFFRFISGLFCRSRVFIRSPPCLFSLYSSPTLLGYLQRLFEKYSQQS